MPDEAVLDEAVPGNIRHAKTFVELLKGSLQTFLNAFTYPDRTCYPVASRNLKDFYNLANVYMDAVLHPRAVGVCREILSGAEWLHAHPDCPEERRREKREKGRRGREAEAQR